jgi:hypothetical protein
MANQNYVNTCGICGEACDGPACPGCYDEAFLRGALPLSQQEDDTTPTEFDAQMKEYEDACAHGDDEQAANIRSATHGCN